MDTPEPTALPSALDLDRLIAACDRRLAAQLDALLHHPAVQALEATWRALWLLVSRIPAASDVVLELLSCSKQDLAADLRDAPEVARSGLFTLVYTRAIGSYGAAPYGLVCADLDFGPGPEDIYLLRQCAAVAAVAHAPFVANVDPELFDLPDLTALPRLRDPAAVLAAPHRAAWQALRACDDARHLALCLPRFLLRAPHDHHREPDAPLPYRESAGPRHADFLWGRASYLFALLAAASFARDRWCVHLLASPAAAATGLLELPTPTLPDSWRRLALECQLPPRSERLLSAAGLVVFTHARADARARARAAPSLHSPPADAPADARLGAELPYVLLAARLAHYLKCVQRERVGTWQDRAALERELESWLRQLVADQDDVQPEVRARRPLRRVSVALEPSGELDGWCRCRLQIQPHLAHNSTAFTLSLVGRLERPLAPPPRT